MCGLRFCCAFCDNLEDVNFTTCRPGVNFCSSRLEYYTCTVRMWITNNFYRGQMLSGLRQIILADSSPGPSALLSVNRVMCLNDQCLRTEQLILPTRSYPKSKGGEWAGLGSGGVGSGGTCSSPVPIPIPSVSGRGGVGLGAGYGGFSFFLKK